MYTIRVHNPCTKSVCTKTNRVRRELPGKRQGTENFVPKYQRCETTTREREREWERARESTGVCGYHPLTAASYSPGWVTCLLLCPVTWQGHVRRARFNCVMKASHVTHHVTRAAHLPHAWHITAITGKNECHRSTLCIRESRDGHGTKPSEWPDSLLFSNAVIQGKHCIIYGKIAEWSRVCFCPLMIR